MGMVAALSGLAAGIGPSVVQFAGAKAGAALAKKMLGDRKAISRYDVVKEWADTHLVQASSFELEEGQAIKDPNELLGNTTVARSSTDSPFQGTQLDLPAADLQELMDISANQSKFVTDITKSYALGKIDSIKPKTLLGSKL